MPKAEPRCDQSPARPGRDACGWEPIRCVKRDGRIGLPWCQTVPGTVDRLPGDQRPGRNGRNGSRRRPDPGVGNQWRMGFHCHGWTLLVHLPFHAALVAVFSYLVIGLAVVVAVLDCVLPPGVHLHDVPSWPAGQCHDADVQLREWCYRQRATRRVSLCYGQRRLSTGFSTRMYTTLNCCFDCRRS